MILFDCGLHGQYPPIPAQIKVANVLENSRMAKNGKTVEFFEESRRLRTRNNVFLHLKPQNVGRPRSLSSLRQLVKVHLWWIMGIFPLKVQLDK